MRFVVNAPAVRAIIGLVVASTLFGMFLVPLVPAWAVRILGGDATTNGFLQSARGVGALAGALLVAALGARADRGGLLKGSSLLFPAAILLFAAMRWLPLSLLAMVLVGTGQIVMLNLCNARIQALTPDPLRGRVMAIYSLSFFGFMPVSALLAGAAAELLGETAAIVLSGTTTLLSSALIVTRLPRGSLDAGPRLRLLSSDEGGGT
jgi:MFS family permease